MRADLERGRPAGTRPLHIQIITGDDRPFAPEYLMYRLTELWRDLPTAGAAG